MKSWLTLKSGRENKFCSLTLTVFMLSGCVMTEAGVNAPSQKADNLLDSYITAKGAAIVTRVSLADTSCLMSQSRLRKVVNGKIDQKEVVTISQLAPDAGNSYLNSLKMRIGGILFTSGEGEKKANDYLKNNPLSFSEISPGNYVVTWLKCEHKDGNIQLGADFPGQTDTEKNKIEPLIGANSIQIGKGQLIDAGTLKIEIFVPDASKPDQKKGRVKAVETPKNQRDLLKQELPEIYKRVRFATFTPYRGRL